MRRRSESRFWWLGPVIVIPFVAIMIGWAIWYNVRHPCIKWRTDTCTSSECVSHLRPGDFTSPCIHWESKTYPCQTCVERKP
jgi:hypothetical protein